MLKKNVFIISFTLICTLLTAGCDYKQGEDPDEDQDFAAIRAINRIIVNETAREADRAPYVSRNYNYAGEDHDTYLTKLSSNRLVDSYFSSFEGDKIQLVSSSVTLDNEELIRSGSVIQDIIQVKAEFYGVVKLDDFLGLEIPTNTFFSGEMNSRRQLDFIKESDGLWRFITEKNIFSTATVNGGEALGFKELVYSPDTSITLGNNFTVRGDVIGGSHYRVQVDWGYEKSGDEDLQQGNSFNVVYNLQNSNRLMPQGRDSIYIQVVGSKLNLNIITGFALKLFTIPVKPLFNGDPL